MGDDRGGGELKAHFPFLEPSHALCKGVERGKKKRKGERNDATFTQARHSRLFLLLHIFRENGMRKKKRKKYTFNLGTKWGR